MFIHAQKAPGSMRYQDVQATKDGPVDSCSPLGRVTQGFCLLPFQGFIDSSVVHGGAQDVNGNVLWFLLNSVYFGSFWKITKVMRFGYITL